MALINCPECSKQISDQSNSCPHCGYPMKPQRSDPESTPKFYGKQKTEKESKQYGCGTFLLILFVGFIVYQCQTSYSDYQERTQQTSTSSSTSTSSTSKGGIPPQFADIAETFDDEALLDSNVTRDDFLLGLSAIRMQRNKCDTISSVALMYGGGIRFTCNNFSLKYEVSKENGKFVIE
jgi:hypothetical protein